MTQKRVLARFEAHIAPILEERGFEVAGGHCVRQQDAVVQVIELQHSIYGSRFTANLGLELAWLQPMVRWIPRPELGPHAHDCTRWVRLGLVGDGGDDTWWSFTDDTQSIKEAIEGLKQALLVDGCPWLTRQGEQAAFLHYARARLERTRTPDTPHGAFLELRLLAVVLAWSGAGDEAWSCVLKARALWDDEKRRLQHARALYKKEREKSRLKGVPDLQAELEALIEPTRGGGVLAVAPKRRRSRSGRPKSSRA